MGDDEFLKEFGLKVKLYRIKKGFTQARLGELVNISEHRISQIENGRCNLTLKTINRISSILNVEALKFFNFDL